MKPGVFCLYRIPAFALNRPRAIADSFFGFASVFFPFLDEVQDKSYCRCIWLQPYPANED
jgi:hypothetical protein